MYQINAYAQCNKHAKTKYFCIFTIDAMKNAIRRPYKFSDLTTSGKQSNQDTKSKKVNALIIKQKGDKSQE